MAKALLALLFALSPQQGDTTATFSNAATAELYARARVRHVRQDSLVRDYQATVHTRMEASAGRSRFASRATLIAHETISEVTWSRPNDLHVRVVGARAILPIVTMLAGIGDVREEVERDVRGDMVMDRPWFIPRALGDSIRVMGVPEHAALHPLADGAVHLYRFAIRDSVTLIVPGRTVRAIEMEVEPRERGPSLVAGRMWLDAETADVVRFRMVFVGDYVWDKPDGATPEDSAMAREESATVNRFVSVEAEVEYALIDRLYWMPSRQFLAVTAELPWFVNLSIPARVVTTFSDYQVNTGATVLFTISEEEIDARDAERDSSDDNRVVVVNAGTRGVNVRVEDENVMRTEDRRAELGYHRAARWRDGRWEMEVPPLDSLDAYEWQWQLTPRLDSQEEARIRETFAALSALEEDLPGSLTGRRRASLAWESVADIMRFNRVQGPSLGAGYRVRTPLRFTSVMAQARLGLADLRPTGSIMVRRDGPGGRFDLTAYRDVREAEPWSGGLGIGNSLNAVFTGHDDADYHLVLGVGAAYGWNHGLLENVELTAAYERHDSMLVAIGAPVPELWGPGDFPVNPGVPEGWYVRGGLRRWGGVGFVGSEQGVDLLTGEGSSAGRAWASLRIPFAVARQSGALTLRAGAMRGDSLPQLYFRLGGPTTVRGFDYGTRWGREVWSAQLDVASTRNGGFAPVAFVDVGDTFASDPMVGAGVGLSLLNGLLRFNLAKGLRPQGGLRFDLLFRAPR